MYLWSQMQNMPLGPGLRWISVKNGFRKYVLHGQTSFSAVQWLQYEQTKYQVQIQHSFHQGEKFIYGTVWTVVHFNSRPLSWPKWTVVHMSIFWTVVQMNKYFILRVSSRWICCYWWRWNCLGIQWMWISWMWSHQRSYRTAITGSTEMDWKKS